MHRVVRFLAALVLTLTLVAVANFSVAPAAAGSSQTYLVLYKGNAVAADAIKTAGGTLVYAYNQIGVAIARSDSTTFATKIAKDSRVEGASATASFGAKIDLGDAEVVNDASDGPVDDGAEPLWSRQWDMVQIHVDAAHKITGGSRSVVVGDIDSGLNYRHPDLAPNVDFANSVSCVGGVPNQDPAAWDDDNGHGTHTAGTIAAAANGIGIVGVAPNVKIAGIKASTADGYFYPEAVVCSFMWAGSHHLDVTNNSYFADPWLFNCRNDAAQRAIWKAEQRAIRYAMQQGVTVVAANGNDNIDLSKTAIDSISPDDTTPLTREVKNACVIIPVEIPGVIGVAANGNKLQKSYYSSYGVGVTQVVAPGGDARFQLTSAAPNGRVYSTYLGSNYAYLQGTSMASPHVAGVAALVVSAHGSKMSPGAVASKINSTADPIACPANPFNPGPPFNYLAVCDGGAGYNGFYGHGQVNALSAVTQ